MLSLYIGEDGLHQIMNSSSQDSRLKLSLKLTITTPKMQPFTVVRGGYRCNIPFFVYSKLDDDQEYPSGPPTLPLLGGTNQVSNKDT